MSLNFQLKIIPHPEFNAENKQRRKRRRETTKAKKAGSITGTAEP
jgi:hypothetical protein